MIRWFVCCVLLYFCEAVLVDVGESNLRVKRRVIPLETPVHYHHNPDDYAALETLFNVGTPSQLGQFIVDTTLGDLEMTVCPSQDPSVDEQPCFDRYVSSTFHHTSALTGIDRFDSALLSNDYEMTNVTFLIRPPKTVNTGRIGCGWPSLKKHPGDTFFPFKYLEHWQRKQFSIALALNGCEGLLDWGNTKNCPDSDKTTHVAITSKGYWQFALLGFEFGDFKQSFSMQAMITTTKEYIGMPKTILKKMMAAYNIRFDGLYGAYTVACNQTLPDFHFNVNNATLTIKSAQLVYQEEHLQNGRCVVNFEDSSKRLFGPEWYFGLPVMTSYCVNFDYDGVRLGFTPNTLICHNCHCHDHDDNGGLK
ncbi:hypothetical protein QR680_005873 [Steinernema hermaphroditum]|uniref:Peptidase A1 domain-containing protein n=1 Tax=Steinernema hermaphroditum TaxID=289476 RepID=A0AA39LW53_9BILA|nr:hypothetical protein QR680_005873 [Steinernema hermaphroditum]